jgi:2-keto-4-pentenoate hydratase/2-oxohepta-3-ene-1,7-dioic acid hydratase in catechol pathway
MKLIRYTHDAHTKFLQPGDTVRVEIEGIGYIENRIVQEA